MCDTSEIYECKKTENAMLKFIAEFLGTAILMFVGCSGAVKDSSTIIIPGITFGIAILIGCQMFENISGAHFNPAVSVGVLILGKITVFQCFYYIIAQFLGAFVGYVIIYYLLPYDEGVCVPHLHEKMTPIMGLFLEALTTATLVFFVAALSDARNKSNESVSVKVGLMIIGLILTAGPFTGAALNPARTLPPSIMNGVYTHNWIYYVGPMFGGVLASTLYRFLIDTSEKRNFVRKLAVCRESDGIPK